MLKFGPSYITDAIDWINSINILDPSKPCYIDSLNKQECEEITKDGNIVFAEYDADTQIITLPMAYPDGFYKTVALKNLFHELCHHIQWCMGILKDEDRDKLEEEAEKWSERMVVTYLSTKKS